MAQLTAQINPKMLVRARETANLSISKIADALKKDESVILSREVWDQVPSLSQAKKYAHLCKRPFALLYLSNPPKNFKIMTEFRRLNSSINNPLSYKLIDIINDTAKKQEFIKELYIEWWESRINFIGKHKINDDIKIVANTIRNIFDFSYEEYLKTSQQNVLNTRIHKIENKNIFIFRDSNIEIEECRWFTIIDKYAPFIFINSNDSKWWQLFSLIHELVHILINQDSIINRDNNNNFIEPIEIYCNKVAAEVLVDSSSFNEYFKNKNIIDIEESELISLITQASKKFKVSPEVIARKLLDNKKIKSTEYTKLRAIYHNDWLKNKEMQKAKAKESNNGPDYYRTKLVKTWYAFTKSILEYYDSGKILSTDVSSILWIKINKLNKMRLIIA